MNPAKITNGAGVRWRVRGRLTPGGKRPVRFFDTKDEANAWLAEQRGAVRGGTYVSPKSIPPFSALIEEHRAARCDGSYRINTAKFVTSQAKHFALLADHKVTSITVAVVEQLRDQLLAQGKMNRTSVNRVLDLGARMYATALRRGYAATNPFALAERLRNVSSNVSDAENDELDDFLNPDEIGQMLEHARPGYDHALLFTVASTGVRINEALALRWQDVDLEDKKLRIRQNLAWTPRVGDQRTQPVFQPTKTAAGKRTIPIHAALVSELRRWKLQCPKGELVFPDESGRPVCSSSILRDVMYATLKRAGLRRVKLHSLRHSYATTLITAGVPVNQISAYLGHANVAITLKIYTHFFSKHDDSAIERVFGSIGHPVVTPEAPNAQSA